MFLTYYSRFWPTAHQLAVFDFGSIHKRKVLKVFTTETAVPIESNKALVDPKLCTFIWASRSQRLNFWLDSKIMTTKAHTNIVHGLFLSSYFLWTPTVLMLMDGLFIPWNQHFTLEAKKIFHKSKGFLKNRILIGIVGYRKIQDKACIFLHGK